MAVAVRKSQFENTNSQVHDLTKMSAVDFTSKLKYDSESSRILRRSQLFKVPDKRLSFDIWKLQPPDFNPQAFQSTPRTARETVRTSKLQNAADVKTRSAPNAKERRRNDRRQKELFRELEELAMNEQRAQTCYDFRPPKERPSWNARFRSEDSLQAKIDFAKFGKHKPEEYEMPQPHDYRQYLPLKLLGLPEFITSYEQDCLGLKCKNRGLGIIEGRPGNFLRQVAVRTKAEYAMPRSPKWDENLMLPKLPFPNKIASFTRHHRTDRSARSAFLERAEEMMEKRRKEVEDFIKSHSKKT